MLELSGRVHAIACHDAHGGKDLREEVGNLSKHPITLREWSELICEGLNRCMTRFGSQVFQLLCHGTISAEYL